jgi:hypothetical protein
MHKDKLLIVAVFVLAVGAVVAYHLLGNSEHDTPLPPPASRGPLIPSRPMEFTGISLQLGSGWAGHPFEQYIGEIAATGANTVHLVIWGYQEDGASTSIFVDTRKAPSDRRLKELIGFSRGGEDQTGKRALKVVLMPIVLLENPKHNEWRGQLAPSSWADWWEDYTHLILHYARIAEETQVEAYMIGSELVTVEEQEDRWRELIRRVREVYKGRLSYSANWDHYKPLKWWDAVDIIGMTSYYDLTKGKPPTLERLKRAWEPIRKGILDWRNSNYPRHPIVFTEVGWPNQVTCAHEPWNYYGAPDKPDPQAQANCFEAFFSTWMDEPAVAGYLVWEWRSYPGQKTGPEDTSYVPCGKPAQEVIERHYRAVLEEQRKREALRAAATRAATRPATRPGG